MKLLPVNRTALKSSSRRAFSLVELLVVLSTVGILAALLLGAFSRVRQNAEKTTCASNLRQLASAMQMYLQDNGGAFPFDQTTIYRKGIPNPWRWSDRVQTIVPIQSIIHCPTLPTYLRWEPGSPDYNLGRDVSVSIYPRTKVARLRLRLLSQIEQPDATELFNEFTVLIGEKYENGRRLPTKICGPQAFPNPHLDGANIAYVDGHVKWMSADAQA